MTRALRDVPVSLPEAPAGLVAYGTGRDRSYVYSENAEKEEAAASEATSGEAPPQPDLDKPPTD
jgi:penicillin-binding protein 1A